MNSITHVLLSDLNFDENAQYIMSTLKYRNIASNIASVMMLPIPEFVFTNDRLPVLKGRRCACVTINCWSDSEAAYEVVSELKKNGTSSIPHIGGIWSAKVIDENMLQVFMEMAGDFRWALDCNNSSASNSDADTDITITEEQEDIDDDNSIYGFEDMNDSDSEIARVFPEDNCWTTVSADGEPVTDIELLSPRSWLHDGPSPIPEEPKLVRYKMKCAKNPCNLCVPLENNYNKNKLFSNANEMLEKSMNKINWAKFA